MAAIHGTARPPIMLYPQMVEALAQCRVELVKRETTLIFMHLELPPMATTSSRIESDIGETKAEIARIDALFTPTPK